MSPRRWQLDWGPTAIDEKRWQAQVLELLRTHGWLCYHTFDSRRSAPGFPDIVAVRGDRLLALECKTLTGVVTHEQHKWLANLGSVRRVEALLVRPAEDISALEELLR